MTINQDLAAGKSTAYLSTAELHARGLEYLDEAARSAKAPNNGRAEAHAAVAQGFFWAAMSANLLEEEVREADRQAQVRETVRGLDASANAGQHD